MRLIFLSLMGKDYSRTGSYFSALTQIHVECEYVQVDPKALIKSLWGVNRENQRGEYIVLVGSASQMLVIPVLFILRKRVYLDAGWSLVESTMVSSSRRGKLWAKVLKTYFIDFSAAWLSKKIFLESDSQARWFRKIFFLPRKKCLTLYTGVDETKFFPTHNRGIPGAGPFTVFFRGKSNPEAGLEVLAEATHLLSEENINFVVLSNLQNDQLIFSKKTLVNVNHFNSKTELANLLALADLSLGQLSGHNRLLHTIPHKAYESAFLGIPYLTARNKGILEIFTEGEEIFCFEPDSAIDLAEKIMFLSRNMDLLEKSARKIRAKYELQLSHKKLAEKLLNELGLA
jgi:glycosyltransferase involved in cell wall biosynthesis